MRQLTPPYAGGTTILYPDAVCGTADNAVVGCLEPATTSGVSPAPRGTVLPRNQQRQRCDGLHARPNRKRQCAGDPTSAIVQMGVSSDRQRQHQPVGLRRQQRGDGRHLCITVSAAAANNTCVPGKGTPNNIVGSEEWLCEGNIAGSTADDTRCVIAVCGDTQGTCDEGMRSAAIHNPWDLYQGGAGSSAA